MPRYRIMSRSTLSGHESTHPIGGYFGIPLRDTTEKKDVAEAVAGDVRRSLGDGFVVWIEEAEAP